MTHDASTPTTRRSWVGPLAVALAVLVAGLTADLVTKHLAWDYFVQGERWADGRVVLYPQPMPHVTALPGLLDFTAVANQGAAMGIGQGRRAVFLTVGVLACVAVAAFFIVSVREPVPRTRRGRVTQGLYRVTLALLLAGVTGNLYDRLTFGYVRDMLHMVPGLRWADLHARLPQAEVFPWVFNFADAYLCVGVAVILLLSFITPEPRADA